MGGCFRACVTFLLYFSLCRVESQVSFSSGDVVRSTDNDDFVYDPSIKPSFPFGLYEGDAVFSGSFDTTTFYFKETETANEFVWVAVRAGVVAQTQDTTRGYFFVSGPKIDFLIPNAEIIRGLYTVQGTYPNINIDMAVGTGQNVSRPTKIAFDSGTTMRIRLAYVPPDPTPVPTTRSSGNSELPIIISLSTAGAVVIGVLVAIAFWRYRKSSQIQPLPVSKESIELAVPTITNDVEPPVDNSTVLKNASADSLNPNAAPTNNPVGEGSAIPRSAAETIRLDPELDDSKAPSEASKGSVSQWEIDSADIRRVRKIGAGAFGDVFEAEWEGKMVAVKSLHGMEGLDELKSEIGVMAKLNHHNIVRYFGLALPEAGIVMEFMAKGSLYTVIRAGTQLSWTTKVQMLLDTAYGMKYLHSKKVVHRDLKTLNLLVSSSMEVKVGDFGLSRVRQNSDNVATVNNQGSPAWMSPEVMKGLPFNESCDVFSFAVIIWELITCEVPWKGYDVAQVVAQVALMNRRLKVPEPLPDGTPAGLVDLMIACWDAEPANRPTFPDIVPRLKSILLSCTT